MREKWIDTIRVMTAMWIYFVHYISAFKSEYFAFWNTDLGYWTVRGITGKLGVAMFAILMGYFAAMKGAGKSRCSEYIVNRYVQFAAGMLIINIIKYIMLVLKVDTNVTIKSGWISILQDAVFLKAGICVTLWCVLDFFLASVVCFLINRYQANLMIQLLICVLLVYIGKPWIAVGVMGSMIYGVQTKHKELCQKFSNGIIQFVLLVVVFLLIKNVQAKTHNAGYTIQGIACGLFVFAMFNNQFLKKIFGGMRISKLGKYAYEIFLLSNPMLGLMGWYVIQKGGMDHLTFWISFTISSIVLVILGIGLHNVLVKIKFAIPERQEV